MQPALTLTVIYAQESLPSKGREKINWKLITDLPVRSRKDAVQMLIWCAMRWKIETSHKILKSACKIADSGIMAKQSEKRRMAAAIY